MEPAASDLVFGKYEVLRRLAVGGMGEIFLARQHGMAGFDRLVILKSLLPDLAVDPIAVEQFLDEARVAATLNHPNIVSIFEVGEWQGGYVIAMEHVRGESLSRIMVALGEDRRRVPALIAARIVHDAALALDHSHAATADDGSPLGIVHRDVSPQNIMVRYDGVTKVLDFGIAKAANRASHTATGQVKGKISYMSPEQATGSDVDRLSDQFSLGVVFWEMVVGARLFHGQNPLQSFVKLTKDEIPRLSQVTDNVLPGLEDVVARMLERDRASRFSTCREVALEIEGILDASDRPSTQDTVGQFLEELREAGRLVDLTDQPSSSSSSLRRAVNSPSRKNEAKTVVTPHPPAIPIDETDNLQLVELKPRGSRAARVAVAVLVIALLGGGGWWWSQRGGTQAAPVEVTSLSPVVDRAEEPPAIDVAAGPPKKSLDTDKGATASSSAGSGADSRTDSKSQEPEKLQKTVRAKPAAKPTKRPPKAQPTVKREKAVAPANAFGFLSIKTKPWTQVTIDGARHGLTPIYRMRLPAGEHTIRLRNEEAGIDVTRSLNIEADETAKLDLDL